MNKRNYFINGVGCFLYSSPAIRNSYQGIFLWIKRTVAIKYPIENSKIQRRNKSIIVSMYSHIKTI